SAGREITRRALRQGDRVRRGAVHRDRRELISDKRARVDNSVIARLCGLDGKLQAGLVVAVSDAGIAWAGATASTTRPNLLRPPQDRREQHDSQNGPRELLHRWFLRR